MSVVLVSPPLTVVAVRGDLDWDVAVPTVVLVTVEAPAVERAVFVPGMDGGVWREVCMVKTLLEDTHSLYVPMFNDDGVTMTTITVKTTMTMI